MPSESHGYINCQSSLPPSPRTRGVKVVPNVDFACTFKALTVVTTVSSSFDLQKQRDKFALAMRAGLGKDRFQLIARRLP
jgi:hypothetical protein